MDLLRASGVLAGMVHLAPLPTSPRFGGRMEDVLRAARRDAEILVEAGFDAILVENYGDLPFYPGSVPAATIAAMSVVMAHLRQLLPAVPFGVNVLRNDAGAALAIAAAAGAAFIRVNVHAGATITDQGLLAGNAHETLRARAILAPCTAIFADFDVKHGRALAPRPLEEEVSDLVSRGLADGVLVTGASTGAAAAVDEVRRAVAAAGSAPVWVASGVTTENAAAYLDAGARGFIIGTSIKRGGRTGAMVDRARAGELVRFVRGEQGAQPAGRNGGVRRTRSRP